MFFLFFNLLIWCITLIDLLILKNPSIPGINSTWSWYMILLMCCWILFARILLRIFHPCSSVILAFDFLPLWYLCLVLVSRWWWPCRMNLGVVLEVFWKSLSRMSVTSSLKFDRIYEAIWTWTSACWKVFGHSFSFSAFISLSIGSLSTCSVLGGYTFEEFVHFFQIVLFIGTPLLLVVS